MQTWWAGYGSDRGFLAERYSRLFAEDGEPSLSQPGQTTNRDHRHALQGARRASDQELILPRAEEQTNDLTHNNAVRRTTASRAGAGNSSIKSGTHFMTISARLLEVVISERGFS